MELFSNLEKLILILTAPTIPIALVLATGLNQWRWNTTGSEPPGFYAPTADPNSLVEVLPSENVTAWANKRGYLPYGESMLKHVVAKAGDTVIFNEHGITVNGRLVPNTKPRTRDSQGRALVPFPYGVYPVEPGRIWVASSYSAQSFDSRYFGPINESNITAHLKPVWTWR